MGRRKPRFFLVTLCDDGAKTFNVIGPITDDEAINRNLDLRPVCPDVVTGVIHTETTKKPRRATPRCHFASRAAISFQGSQRSSSGLVG